MTSSVDRFSVSSPADILGYIPHALGFVPQESVVLMTLGSNILGATLRLDIPDRNYLEFAVHAHGFLKQDRTADSVIAVLYTDAAQTQPDSPPHAELMHCLELVLESEGVPVRAAWLVSEGFWRDFSCNGDCCPWPGHSLAAVTDSELNTELIYRGSSYEESLEAALVQTVGEPWQDRAVVETAQRAWHRSLEGRWREESQFAAVLRVWETALQCTVEPAWITKDPDVAAYLLASLESRTVRDTVLVMAASGIADAVSGAHACDLVEPAMSQSVPLVPPSLSGMGTTGIAQVPPAMVDGAGRERAEQIFAGLLIGTSTTAPLWPRLDHAHDLFRLLAAVASGESRCALLTMLGWIEWARGRGSRAGGFFDMCLSLDASYRLAQLLVELLNRGQLPAWAVERESAWSGHRTRAA